MVPPVESEEVQKQVLAAAMADGVVTGDSEPRYPQTSRSQAPPAKSKTSLDSTDKSGQDQRIWRSRSLHRLFSTGHM